MIVKILVYTLIKIFISLKLKIELLYIKYQTKFISCQCDNPFPTPISLPSSPTHHWTYETIITVKKRKSLTFIWQPKNANTPVRCPNSRLFSSYPFHNKERYCTSKFNCYGLWNPYINQKNFKSRSRAKNCLLTFSTIFITYKLDLKTLLGSENSIGSAKLLKIF